MYTMRLKHHVSCLYAGVIVVLMLLSSATEVTAQHPEWMVYTTENSELPSNEVIELVFAQGVLWIGTRRGGLAKFNGEAWWMVYPMDSSELPASTIPAVAFDTRGRLWVGTDNGLSMFDHRSWYVYTTEKTDLPYDAIHALAFDAQGMLWVGTGRFNDSGGGGLAKLERWKWVVYTTDNSDLPGNQILALAIDSQGHLWVGTVKNGAAAFDGETWTVYTPDNSELPAGDVSAIISDARGTIWIGTADGLARFDGMAWTVYTPQNSGLPHNNVHALTLDAQGNLWVGTERGLAKFDGAAWTAYTPDNSELPHGWIWALTPDIQGNLWIGTKDGLAVYREGGVVFPEKPTRGYDRKLVVNTMRSIKKINSRLRFAALDQAENNGNFFPVAEQLMELAKKIKSLDVITPAIGSKDAWDRIHGNVIKAAFQGIGACGEEDVEKLKISLHKITELVYKSHDGRFKKY